MKKQYNNKLELKNIISKAIIKPIKFNSFDKAKRYLKSEGYRYRQSFNHKEDRTMYGKINLGGLNYPHLKIISMIILWNKELFGKY